MYPAWLYFCVFSIQAQHFSAIISDMKGRASYIDNNSPDCCPTAGCIFFGNFAVAVFCHSFFPARWCYGRMHLPRMEACSCAPTHQCKFFFCDIFRHHNPTTEGKMDVNHHNILSSLQCALPGFQANVFIRAENYFNSKPSQFPWISCSDKIQAFPDQQI